MNALPCHVRYHNRSFLLAVIVEKSKKCLDFSVTLFLLHLLLCTVYNGLPTALEWWIVHVLATIAMVVLGEYICSRRELDDIPLLQI
jgi:protein SYS1